MPEVCPGVKEQAILKGMGFTRKNSEGYNHRKKARVRSTSGSEMRKVPIGKAEKEQKLIKPNIDRPGQFSQKRSVLRSTRTWDAD